MEMIVAQIQQELVRSRPRLVWLSSFFFQAEDGIRYLTVTGVQTCALPILFGYASDETASLMPVPIVLAHRLAERLAGVRKAGDLPWLRPDGKTQVSVVYEGARPVGVSKLVVSTQHSDMIDNAELREGVIALVVRPVLADEIGRAHV